VAVFLWHVNMQQSIHDFHIRLSWINFFRQM